MKNKKGSINKKKIVARKKASTKTPSRAKKKKVFTTENILAAIFGILLIVVIVLSVMVFTKSCENKDKVKANLVVPIFQTESEENIGLILSALANEDEYVLKITNYKDDKVIAEKVNYKLVIENDTDTIIKVTKDKSSKDLMEKQKSTTIDNQELKGNEKEEEYYHFSITKKGKIDSDDKVNIKIVS